MARAWPLLLALILLPSCGQPAPAARQSSPAAASRSTAPPSQTSSSPASTPLPTLPFLADAEVPAEVERPQISCNGPIGATDAVVLAQIGDQRVLRDYADADHPRNVCTLSGLPPAQLIDSQHLAFDVTADRGEFWVVVDLPRVVTHWFQMPTKPVVPGVTYAPRFLGFSPRLDAVVWRIFDPSTSNDNFHLTTAAGDQLVTTLPSSVPGRCGSPEDSKDAGFASAEGLYFVIDHQDASKRSLAVVRNGQPLLRLLPDSGGWQSGTDGPNMALWSPTSDRLYYRQSGDVWTWAPGSSPSRFLPGVSWYYPTISADGRHLAYSVLRPDGLHDVYLADLGAGTPPVKIGPARNLPMFLNANQLWYRSEGRGGCGPSGDKPLIYDLRDGIESAGLIDNPIGAWPATSGWGV